MNSINLPRRRRWPWFLVGAAVLLALLVAVALPMLLDIERHRGRIEDALREATGWEPELGEMRFSVLRGLVLEVSPVALRESGDGSGFEAESLLVKADIAPLLRGRLEVRRVELVRPDLELVRKRSEDPWPLPIPVGSGDPEQAPSLEIAVDRIEVSDGTVRIIDRSADPPVELGLERLRLTFRPEAGSIEGSAALTGGGGELSWNGDPGREMIFELEAFQTDALAPLLGNELLRPGGAVSGTVAIRQPLEIVGELRLDKLGLQGGEAPLDRSDLTFRIVSEGETLRLVDSTFSSGGVRVSTTGELTPALGLNLQVHESPIEDVLRVSRAVATLPLELEPPGTAEASIRLETADDGSFGYRADGKITAASFRAVEFLPPAEDVGCDFTLSRDGQLELRVRRARIAGGPMQGTLTVESIDPFGPMVFAGELTDAGLGGLLDGFIVDAAERIAGPTRIKTRMTVDPGKTLETGALRGDLSVSAREVTLPGWDLEGAIHADLTDRLGRIAELAALLGDKRLDEAQADSGSPSAQRLLDDIGAKVSFDGLPWRLQRFELTAGDLTAHGSGTFDPLTGQVALDISAALDAEKTAELVRKNGELRALVDDGGRLTVPIDITGSMIGPKIRPDLGQLAMDQLGTDDPEEKLKGLLRGLLE